ncbi:MAG: dtpA 1 [Gammaproteobacteria bacterium]|jgi:POT family proton-dependent oligopeptide transporter|nr:dtpA 1 [Gammaproteobacteria bacterium]
MENTQAAAKQPSSLYLLSFTELWERFGFYTVQTIMVLYMTKALHMADGEADMLYAAFSSLLYLTPILGGYLADRYLGFQRSIMIGGVLLAIAYLTCAFPNRTIFFLGLSILICANGFFKPNVSSIVGELYAENDPRRDGGFTIFYIGINIGALVPPLIAGVMVNHYGWHSGFLLAAAGMIIGQIVFIWGKKRLGNLGNYPKNDSPTTPPSKSFYALLALGTIFCIGLCELAFTYAKATDYAVIAAAIATIVILTFMILKLDRSQQKRMIACLILIAISVIFWSVYNQTFTSLMLFADRNMTQRFLGLPFDAEATQFFNPFFIIVFGAALSSLWVKLDKRGLNPSTPMKFSLAVLFMSAGFFLLAFTTHYFSNNQGQTASEWLGLSYMLQTIGELLISPIGLAMITVLSPKKLEGMMMGVWFFSQAASFAIGGILANIAAVPDKLSAQASLPIYSHAFMVYGYLSLAITVISFALVPFLKRLVQGTHQG